MSEKIEFRKKRRIAPHRAISGIALAFLMLAVAGLFILQAPRNSHSLEPPQPSGQSRPPTQEEVRTVIVDAAGKASPAVVSIGVVTTQVVRGHFPEYDEFFHFFFGDIMPPSRLYRYRQAIPNIGSGVIVSPDGYVVTNEHVVHGAEEITVVTPDGLTLTGELAGVHEPSDIAIIKVDAENLPYVAMGDSDDLMVGEWAIAIGNPFGNLLEDAHPSVTLGVVSAKMRSFKPDPSGRVYVDMIQTDAAINPGNSGGPLVNYKGEAIGINTFIFTRSGGSLGIGFAIPINRVKKILDEVERYGRVRDVWLGFTVATVDEETARALGLPAGGALVRSVEMRSPADQAGLRAGDIITHVNARAIRNADDVITAFGSALVGESFSITVLQKNQELALTLNAQEAKR
ncbi:MAG: PDZ domain-containing protein [Candidatus Abyssobacteria bacterium SURF_5]|uniref:PDZ domain-containing protein n=1 Tax=Abyssobacteria bacterium (strain SURF_5) TaxID=2093360 RepID=A0A3A4N3S8_ABYX5|nr:MAG: PDZ domain-containing protein [Candidatus Abyssubacteria bacterium SURF_5]